jgi:hypothetical protein
MTVTPPANAQAGLLFCVTVWDDAGAKGNSISRNDTF